MLSRFVRKSAAHLLYAAADVCTTVVRREWTAGQSDTTHNQLALYVRYNACTHFLNVWEALHTHADSARP
jgi:hypothetical protein